MVKYFLQALERTYYGHLISAIGKSFNDVVKMGEMVEEGLKSSKIMSYSAIKATTQAIQNGTGSLLGKKKKEDVAMVVSGSWNGPRGSPHQYTHPRPRPQTYTQAPYNPPQHYFSPQKPQYSARPSQYLVHHAQSYAQPPLYPQWHAPAPQNIYPAPQNTYPPPQPFQNLTGSNFRPRPEYRRERQQRNKLLPRLESPMLVCFKGHDIEKFWRLKTAIQELIYTNQIVVQSPDAPNINRNPLPAHEETHMIEIVHKDGEPKKSSKSVKMIRASESNLVKALDSTKAKPLTVEGGTEKQSSLDLKPPVLVVKGMSKDIGASPESPKVLVPGIPSKPVIVVKGAPITPIIIKPVTQLPVVDAKAVPWNYRQVIVTYKGREIEEEVNETGGLTRSGRSFSPEELRKAKPFKDSQMPVMKSVTEEEAEEFLKKMKVQDYSIVDQVLMKILNEAHVPDKITVNHLEKIASKIFEVNRITFSDDELPMEGTEHNRALYLTVKCEDSVVSRVLVDNGSNWHRKNPLEQCVCSSFDGGGKDSVGDIMLELSIGPVEFTMEFQVLDVVVSYNLLLGRPWIHAAKVVPSSLHQMVKFEWDRQEIVVHGDEDLST
ncbi:PREDICTED: uncharacterized protein LOC109222744, partial [Nicotiana attenuata]|uniref:uncharacterized protein LOC109222744 n=1 Tax=Nicotiana attenuata TaxID=49451 RepID=UPI000904ED80